MGSKWRVDVGFGSFHILMQSYLIHSSPDNIQTKIQISFEIYSSPNFMMPFVTKRWVQKCVYCWKVWIKMHYNGKLLAKMCPLDKIGYKNVFMRRNAH